ncbi:MAG: condensation domain-containing protein, partial [Chlamydiales bacterium]|nr:condensation domain-containing protein [Chlamydiales bacterium]
LPVARAPVTQIIPQDGLEGQIWNLWSELLGHSHFGFDDNFFDVGGNSLKALKMIHALKVRLAKVCSFSTLMEYPTISALTQQVTDYSASSNACVTDKTRLSSIERRIWMDCQNPQSSKAYNILSAFEVQIPLNIQKLEKLVQGMVDDYPILRTGFVSEKNEIVRKVYSPDDLSSYFSHITSDSEESLIEKEAQFLFDLEKGPLFRLTILERSDEKCFVLFNIHHIIADADTLVLFFTELFSRYLGISEEQSSQTEAFEIEQKETSGQFWQRYLANIPLSPLNLPYDLEGKTTYQGSSTSILLPPQKASFTVYCLALFITLYKLTGREDIVVGFPVSLRDHAELEHQLGCFLNTLPLHFAFKASDTVQTLMDNLKQNILEVLEHKDFSEASRPGKMYSVMIDMLHEEHLKVPQVLQELNIMPRKIRSRYTKTDLIFYIHEKSEASQLVIEYSIDRFCEDTVQYIAQTFVDILHNMMENLGTSIEDVVNIESLEFGAL